jgi:hypothetical protein
LIEGKDPRRAEISERKRGAELRTSAALSPADKLWPAGKLYPPELGDGRDARFVLIHPSPARGEGNKRFC